MNSVSSSRNGLPSNVRDNSKSDTSAERSNSGLLDLTSAEVLASEPSTADILSGRNNRTGSGSSNPAPFNGTAFSYSPLANLGLPAQFLGRDFSRAQSAGPLASEDRASTDLEISNEAYKNYQVDGDPVTQADTPNTNQQEMDTSQPVILENAVSPRTPLASELGAAADRAQLRLDRGDRAGAYIELYKVTGSEQILLQAQITSYSGAVGGMALEGNFRAKMANPEDYTLTLDQFSHDIDRAVITLAKQSAESGEPEKFNTLNIMKTDSRVWQDNSMGNNFPGNAQFIGIDGYEDVAVSTGSEVAILSQDEIELGRRPAEYADDPQYTTTTSQDGRFITVVDNNTNRVEVFFDTEFESDRGSMIDAFYTPDLEQLRNEIPSQRVASERTMKMDFLQAGTLAAESDLPIFDTNAPRPPENLDRVFAHEGKLYQVSDSALFEKHGVDIGALTRNEGLRAGMEFGAALNEVGTKVENVIEDRYHFNRNRESDFQTMVTEGVITPLTDAETEYYENSVESLGSPYQSTDDAMKNLGSNLFRPIMYLGENHLEETTPANGNSENT